MGEPQASGAENFLSDFSDTLVHVVRRAAPLVVGIRLARTMRSEQGSGVIVHPEFVVTNAHVVRQLSHIEIHYEDGGCEKASIHGMDPHTDLALLRLRRQCDRVMVWGDSHLLDAGQLVVTIANPMGLDRTASIGLISSTHRRFSHDGRTWIHGVLQTDAAVAPGSSGGALLTVTGRLVGIILASNSKHAGLAFAIPSATAEWVVDEIIHHRMVRRSVLGLQLQTVPLLAEINDPHSLRPTKRCVLVRQVTLGLPGAQAGLRPGDRLLYANGRPLEDVHLVQRYLGIRAVGREVVVDFLRHGRCMRTGVIPAARVD
jgi:S1-C subfamily serine protease